MQTTIPKKRNYTERQQDSDSDIDGADYLNNGAGGRNDDASNQNLEGHSRKRMNTGGYGGDQNEDAAFHR